MEAEYLQNMQPKAAFFFFYSFHPHNSIRTVCSRITRILRGKRSEVSFIETVQEEVEGMIEQALNGTNPSLVLCSCSCLQSLLSLPQDASSQERFIHSLELLFEKENEWLLLDEGASWKKLIHETVRGNCIHSLPR